MATSKPLLRRERVRDQIAQQRRIRKRIKLNETGAQFRNAGIFNVAVDQHHAFLADIRIETAESNGEIGILVKPDSRESLIAGFAEGMTALANSPDLRERLGQAGLARAKAHFDWDRKIDQIAGLYELAIKSRADSAKSMHSKSRRTA